VLPETGDFIEVGEELTRIFRLPTIEKFMEKMQLVKNMSIAAGLYGPARQLSRFLHPQKRHSHLEDILFFKSLLAPGTLCYDIGANIGEKSEALLKAGARVIAFEPNLLLVNELKARCGWERNWTLVTAALGSSAGIATLYARQIHGLSSLAEEGPQSWQGKLVDTLNVPVLTLDMAIEKFGRPFYCKIDVEGWEFEVLTGLSQCIPLLSFEFHLTDKDMDKTKACLKKLSTFGSNLVNVTPAEKLTFHFPEWLSLENFCKEFPGNLSSLPGEKYGDIFVKNLSAFSNEINNFKSA
jgi:FkbM family methyltransferase